MKKFLLYLGVAVSAIAALVVTVLAMLRGGEVEALKAKKRQLERRRELYERSDVETAAREADLARKLTEINNELEKKVTSPADPNDAADRLGNIMRWDDSGADEN